MPPRLDAAGLALAAFFFVLTALYVPFLLDPANAARWAWMAVGTAAYAIAWAFGLVSLWPRLTAGHALGLAFLALAVLSLLWTPAPLHEGADALWQLLVLAGLFSVGAGRCDLRPAWLGAGLGMAINSAIVISQAAGWNLLGMVNTGLDGLFFNRNWSAEAAALVAIGCASSRLPWLAAAALPPVLLSGARAAALAVAVSAFPWLWRRSRAAVLAIAIAGAAAVSWLHLGAGAAQRLDVWTDTAEALTWRGHGIGSFWLDYPAHAPRINATVTRPEHAHNDFLEVAYELGPAGALAFLALLAYALGGAAPARPVVAGFAVIACFSFPLHQPVPAALAALCCGHLCRDRPHLRYLLACGRMALFVRRRDRSCVSSGAHAKCRGLVPARWPLPRRARVFL